jgi:hypothetical protein
MKKVLIVLLVIGLLAGLGIWKLVGAFQKSGQLGDAAIEHFHSQFNAKSFAEIFNESSSKLRQSGPPEKFIGDMEAMRAKLGAHKSGTRDGLNLNNSNGDKTLTMKCVAVFENGPGTETFTFDYNGDTPLLMGYFVESPALLK